MKKETKVTITFEDNENPNKKAVMTITNDKDLELKFEPEINKGEGPKYAVYAMVITQKFSRIN